MKAFGIDVSRWQGDFNFQKAKAEGVQYAILKAGGGDAGLYQDRKFETYYAQAKSIGMPVGAYFFGCAASVEKAVEEADMFISILAGKQFEYPVYYDVEGKMIKQDKTLLTDEIIAFCERMEAAGYYVGVYSSESFYNNNMEDARLASYAHWVAKYSSNAPKLRSGITYGMWQYGGEKNYLRSNRIAGVVCDQDYAYADYPKIIKAAGLNGYTTEGVTMVPTTEPDPAPETIPEGVPVPAVPSAPSSPTLKSVDEIAQEIILGKWGDGDERKAKLTAAGYDAAAVQAKVNEFFAAQTTTTKKTNKEIAQEVVDGKWGNGEERKARLKAAGYSMSVIQRLVNQIMSR